MSAIKYSCVKLLIFSFLLLAASITPAAALEPTGRANSTGLAEPTGRADSTGLADSTTQQAIFQRPFILSTANTSLGGYVEANGSHTIADGVGNGLHMEIPRFNIFLFSNISARIRFLAELEFEHGTEEINVETALLDIEVDRLLILRAGIILLPIGGFNVRHDSPLYEFIRRPLVSTEIIPATLSTVGGGAYGSATVGDFVFTYDAYVSNGLNDGIIFNTDGRTLLKAGKSATLFGEEGNGSPALSGRLALRNRSVGELGVSTYHGLYNTFEIEGEVVDAKRTLTILAVDFSMNIGPVALRGEGALNIIDVPASAGETFGRRQNGVYAEAVVPVATFAFLDYPDVVFNAGLRFDHIDYNVGRFNSTGTELGDDATAATVSFSLRPTPSTVIMFNFRRQWQHDVLGNEATHAATYALGIASYF